MDLLILVLLGTQDKSFTRLLQLIEKEIINGNITDEVVVQAGHTKYNSPKMKVFDLIEQQDFDNLIDKANLVITHGGVGSIIGALRKGKKVIACSRLKKYNEHTNDHQLQIINNFAKEGYILALNDSDNLGNLLKRIDQFNPKSFVSNNDKIINVIDKFIENN